MEKRSLISALSAEQYRKSNRINFAVDSIVIGIAFLTAVATGFMSGFTIPIIVEILLDIVGYGLAVFGRTAFVDKREGSLLIMGGPTLVYFTMLVVHTELIYLFWGLVIMISCIVYQDVRLTIAGQSIIVVGTAIMAIRLALSGGMSQAIMISFLLVFLSAVATFETIRLLRQFSYDDMTVITDGAKKQEEANIAMAEVAGSIASLFDNAQDTISEVNDILSTNHDSMRDIAGSTETNAQAITVQSEKCSNIQSEVDSADQKKQQMVVSSRNAQATIKDGQKVIRDLKQQTANVVDASQVTVASTKAVTEKVSDVQNIVGTILSISKQTNLLALNASIEAARAGEAGKGFAVVAEEIRQLSEQTNEASNRITTIIGELTTEADKAMEAIDKTVQSVDDQNKLIDETEEKFTVINENVDELIDRFNDIGESMDVISASTVEINDSISNLSATSEEVASLSNEGETASAKAVEKFAELNDLLRMIYDEAQKLK
ncbi:MAG: hypothetical protein IJ589_01245 [Lachnospiraceae bacterium]|nr:hypothetical protein [Lachnospiraceae bacterium]